MRSESVAVPSSGPIFSCITYQTEHGMANHTQGKIILTIPADLEYVHILSRCACALLSELSGLDQAESTLYNLELAIQEIGVNIVTHAYADYPGQITMTAERNDVRSQMTITLEDRGRSFDPHAVPTPELGTLHEHGYGLFIANELLDELHYEADATSNRWRLTKSYTIVD